MIITITNDEGRYVTFAINDSYVEVLTPNDRVRFSRDDGRQLRRLLEYLG